MRMNTTSPQRWTLPVIAISLSILNIGGAAGQNYPSRPIRIVTTELGGGSDFTARVIAPALATGLGQQVVVDNRASGVIPGSIVSKALPDGYTLLVYGGTFWLGPLLQDHTPYDVVRDFSPISLIVNSPNVLVVHPSLAAGSVKELIALAKQKPGTLNYGTAGTGSSNHLAGELFKVMAAIDIVRINYKGTGLAINDLIAGRVHMMLSSAASVTAQIKAGRMRALAVTSAQPSALFPALPTIAASGVPGYEAVSSFGLFAPAKTPDPIIARLNQETAKVLKTTEVKERFFNAGTETVGGSPQAFAAHIRFEMARMGKLIKDAGIRID